MTRPGAGRAALLAVLALAFLVRIVAFRWGLPDATHYFSYHPDEFSIAGTADGMINTGDPNPRFFNYGSLMIYLTAAVAAPLKAVGALQTVAGVHAVARLWTLLFALGSVALAAAVAGRIAGPMAAGLAGFFLAILPGHVLHSGFATVDVPAGFFVIATTWAALRAAEQPSPRRFLVAGALAGLAAATKYNAGLAALVPVTAALALVRSAPAGERLRWAAFSVAGTGIAFVLAMPYALLDFETFRRHVSFELFEHARQGHGDVFVGTGNGWLYHLRTNLPYLAGIPVAIAAGIGLVGAVRRRSPGELLLLAFAVPYFVGLGFSEVRFLRYLLPLAPALAILAAVPLARALGPGAERRRVIGTLGVAVLTLSLAVLTSRQQLAFSRTDPRTRAAVWLDRNAGPGTRIGLAKIPWYYTPPVTPWNGGPDLYPNFVAAEEQRGRWRFTVCRNWSVAELTEGRPEYFLLSEFERREEDRLGDPTAQRFLRALEERYRPVATFDRFPAGQRRMFGPAFAPHDWLYPFGSITIWQRARG